jgi:hypothetical protein
MITVTSILVGHDEQLVQPVPALMFGLDTHLRIQQIRYGQRITVTLLNEFCHSVRVSFAVLYKTCDCQIHIHRPLGANNELELGPGVEGRYVTDVLPACIVEYFIINHR